MPAKVSTHSLKRVAAPLFASLVLSLVVYVQLITHLRLHLPERLDTVSPVHRVHRDALGNKIYAIPARLIFTFRSNLLRDNITDETEKLIRANVERTIAVYEQRDGISLDIMFLDDDDCIKQIKFLADEPEFASLDVETLLRYYHSVPGAVKGDICRGIVLYRNGGYYLDVDVVPFRQPLWELTNHTVDFITARNAPWPPPPHEGKPSAGFFQAIWAARPYHPVTLQYLRNYEKIAKTGESQFGVLVLEDAYNQVLKSAGKNGSLGEAQLLQEGWLWEGKDLDVPRLNGTGCCCHAVVRVGENVGFYSRAPGTGGSNSCGLPE